MATYKKIPIEMRDHLAELTANELKVWLYMYLRTGKENTAFPSNRTIANATGMNLGTVKIARKGLRDKGWFQPVQQLYREDGGRSTMVEKTTLPWVEKQTMGRVENPPTGIGGNSDLPHGGKNHPSEVDTVSKQIQLEVDSVEVPSLTDGNEGSKEGNASLADARYANAVATDKQEKPEELKSSSEEQEKPKQEKPETLFPADYTLEDKIEFCGLPNVEAVENLWFDATGLKDASDHRELTCELLYEYGYNEDDFQKYMRMALKDCPKTAGVKWRDWAYFAKNWSRTYANVLAWERQKQARLHDRADLSRHGACQKCSISPAAKSNGFCFSCETKMFRAQTILDSDLAKNHLLWQFGEGDKTKHYIGTKEEELFFYLKNENFNTKCSRLADQPKVMDRLEELLNGKGKAVAAGGFDEEEA